MCMCISLYMYVYIYIYIYREREREMYTYARGRMGSLDIFAEVVVASAHCFSRFVKGGCSGNRV